MKDESDEKEKQKEEVVGEGRGGPRVSRKNEKPINDVGVERMPLGSP